MKNLKKHLTKWVAVISCCILFTTSVAAAVPAWTNVNGVFYNDQGEVIKGAIAKGIDVSHYQGEIDWAKVKESDIEFAIIKCGEGDDLESQDDDCFEANVKGCTENNISYGIYLFSYATNTTMAKSEAAHVLRLIKKTNAKPNLPIYYDIEHRSQEKLSPALLGDIAETFCNEMTKAGYKTGVYSNLNFWNTKLTDKRFDRWDKWVARYNSSTCGYGSKYNIWQYTQSGKVDGINANLDVNILLSKECSIVGHTYVVDSVLKKANASQTGLATYKCSVCGSKKTESTPKIESIYFAKKSYVYTGKEIKPSVIIKDDRGKDISKTFYSISYINNIKSGQATVKITFKGIYEGVIIQNFIIKPAKTKLSKVTKLSGKKVKLTWKKTAGADGYEICYAPNKSFKKGKIVIAKSSAKSKTIKKLKKNKTYYFRIRAYKKVNRTKVYGAWSSKKRIKIAK